MTDKTIRLILGNQLFPIQLQNIEEDETVFMCEDSGLCTYEKHHKSKIALFFNAMRSFRDSLEAANIDCIYYDFNNKFEDSYIKKLSSEIKDNNFSCIRFFEIEDKPFENEIMQMISDLDIKCEVLNTPMFLDSRESFKDFVGDKKFLLQANYYKKARKEMDILIENEKPVGGKWSFDDENRKKLPKDYLIPKLPVIKERDDSDEISNFINTEFNDHPGNINNIFPYTTEQALDWLDTFFEERFKDFGPYEDAIFMGEHFQLHSALSSSMNLGIITPQQIITKAKDYAEANDIPLNSLEGFVRQIIGWREFIRGIYQNFSEKMINSNYWNHNRKLSEAWYTGDTGIEPLDDAIKGALEFGYTHHINRLMVLASIMNMSRIHPSEIYKWFMEMFVDSSEWVMVPNVFGMGTFADGGIFATKPYISGSSYILRMSNFKKGDWCEIVDGLYWKFIEDNKEFFAKNPRLSLMIRALEKLDQERKLRIFKAAEIFIEEKTL
tara:strand:- start:296 stop:1783 length:1488 start_codon:yes stop_codon:yes gene_type:complete